MSVCVWVCVGVRVECLLFTSTSDCSTRTNFCSDKQRQPSSKPGAYLRFFFLHVKRLKEAAAELVAQKRKCVQLLVSVGLISTPVSVETRMLTQGRDFQQIFSAWWSGGVRAGVYLDQPITLPLAVIVV